VGTPGAMQAALPEMELNSISHNAGRTSLFALHKHVFMALKSKKQPSTPAAFHNILSPNLVVGHIPNQVPRVLVNHGLQALTVEMQRKTQVNT